MTIPTDITGLSIEELERLRKETRAGSEDRRRVAIALAEHERGERVDEDGEGQSKKSASTILVDLARDQYSFGVSDAGETFAVPVAGPKVVSLLRGGKTSLRRQLARQYFELTGKAAPQQALADALLVIEGLAQDEEESVLHLRVADHGGAIWLDLGDHSGRAVRISDKGWTIENEPPVLFRRSALNSVLPDPVHGGDLGELWSWLNVTEEDRPLILAWLIAAMFPDVPHPILDLSGEQGSGKSTAEKVLVSLVDPSPVPTRKPPRDADVVGHGRRRIVGRRARQPERDERLAAVTASAERSPATGTSGGSSTWTPTWWCSPSAAASSSPGSTSAR